MIRVVLGKHVLKLLRPEPTLRVVRLGIRPVLSSMWSARELDQISARGSALSLSLSLKVTYLCLVYRVDIHPKERVRDIRAREACRIREARVDDDHGDQREDEVEPQLPEAHVRVPRVDLAVAVAIPEQAVLLEDRLYGRTRVSQLLLCKPLSFQHGVTREARNQCVHIA